MSMIRTLLKGDDQGRSSNIRHQNGNRRLRRCIRPKDEMMNEDRVEGRVY
jgi:hypothetical protein